MFSLGSVRSPAAKVKPWRNMPLTPGRIPSFIIPPKLHLSASPRHAVRRPREVDEYSLLSSSSPEADQPGHPSPQASPRLLARLRFTPRSKRAQKEQSDPCTRAAMSLEHVEKVTTPYGFCTLAASPHVGRRESLFHKKTKSRGEQGSSSTHHSPHPVPQDAAPSLEPCSPAETPVRRKLKLLLRSPRSALKNHCRKTQEGL